MTLKIIDTFSGIGGFSYAAEKLVGGFETIQFVECEPYAQKILKKHWPDIPIHDDIKTYNPKPYSADVICGGFPCQDISTAGQGKGITEETRSGLFYELIRVIRLVRPKYIVLENVAAILNNGLGIVLGELAKAGFDCEWACIPASALGACHIRDRWWLIAYPNHYGSSSTEKSRSIEETNGRTEKRQNETGKLEGSSQPRHSEVIQVDVANSMFKGLQGLRGKHELQESSRERTFTWRNSGITLEQDWKRYISKSVLRRGDDGLSNRIHRLKALGNSIVPQVAAIPLQRVLDLQNYC